MNTKTVCFYCIRKVWQVFAITLVLLAVIVSVVKYSLPYANDYKDDKAVMRMINFVQDKDARTILQPKAKA